MEQTILIPGTDLKLSPMGFGTVSAGVKWDGKEAEELFDTYLNFGGNLIDSARVYNDWVPGERGRSERVIGDWLKKSGKRNQVVLSTKGGHPDMTVQKPDMHQNRLTRQEMRKDLEKSLKALQTDYIDLYFYHRDCVTLSVEELLDTMEAFVKEGKIRYYGCSNWTDGRMREADYCAVQKGCRGLIADQALYNVGTKGMKPPADDTLVVADETIQAYHRETPQNLLMPYTGNCGGFFQRLVESGIEAVQNSPYFTEANLHVASRLQKLTEKYQISMTQAVLGFFTQQDFPCLPLYTASSPKRLADAAKTFEIKFSSEDYR